jgi:hypothetical protein
MAEDTPIPPGTTLHQSLNQFVDHKTLSLVDVEMVVDSTEPGGSRYVNSAFKMVLNDNDRKVLKDCTLTFAPGLQEVFQWPTPPPDVHLRESSQSQEEDLGSLQRHLLSP